MKKFLSLFLPLILGIVVGLIINTDNYSYFDKPPLSPPAITFPIVWTILYILMGISYTLSNKNENISKVYYLQLIFNYLWTFIFFTLDLKFLAIIWLIILIVLVFKMYKLFKEDNKISAYLQIPYIIWLFIALYLNIGVYVLN